MALERMDNVGIVVESLDAPISFFAEVGLELEGRATMQGDWSTTRQGLQSVSCLSSSAGAATSRD